MEWRKTLYSQLIQKLSITTYSNWLVGWLFGWFYAISTLIGYLIHMYQIYTYIYDLKYVYFGNIFSLIHIWLNIIDIFCLHIFVNTFKLLYWSYDIRRELVDKPSIISYFSIASSPTLCHHPGKMYNKSDVTFVCTLLLCKNERLYRCIM